MTSNLPWLHSQQTAHFVTSNLISLLNQWAIVTSVTSSNKLIHLSETLAEESVETLTTSHKDRVMI